MSKMTDAGPPCLLTMPNYAGTLAAVRVFGEQGIGVTIAGAGVLAPARWSSHAQRVLACPEPRDTERFMDWLLHFGEREPGFFLYPTSDDLAWLFAARAAQLEKHFVTFQPPLATLIRLLDKRALHQVCAEAGVKTVPTWFPNSAADARRLAKELEFPIIIKPRTQVLLSTLNKGHVVSERAELIERYESFLATDTPYAPAPMIATSVIEIMIRALARRLP